MKSINNTIKTINIMSTNNFFRNAVENPLTTALLLVITIVMAVVIYGDIQGMRAATTGGMYWVTIVFFLVPKFLKDTMKLKEEQELTI